MGVLRDWEAAIGAFRGRVCLRMRFEGQESLVSVLDTLGLWMMMMMMMIISFVVQLLCCCCCIYRHVD